MNIIGNRYTWLGILVFLASIGLWFRSSLFGFDSYATLSAVRFGWFDTLSGQPIANIVWSVLPDSLFVFNLIMFVSLLMSIIPIFLLIKHFYDERSAWISVFLLLSLSPVLLFGFGEFENEILAYPFIVWSVYYFCLKNWKTSSSFLFFGLLFWFFPFYFSFWNGFSSGGAIEQGLFAGLLNLWLLLPFVFVIPLFKDRFLRFSGLFAVGLWLWNAKLFIFVIPFIGLSLAYVLNQNEWLNKHLFGKISSKTIVLVLVFCMLGWNVAFVLQSPTQNEWITINTAITLSKDNNLPLYNDWSYGYWLWSKEIKTKYNPGTGKNPDYDLQGVYITSKDLNCLLIEKKESIAKTIKVWQCN